MTVQERIVELESRVEMLTKLIEGLRNQQMAYVFMPPPIDWAKMPQQSLSEDEKKALYTNIHELYEDNP